MNEKNNKKVKEAMNVYLNNISEFASKYKSNDKYGNEICYKNGFLIVYNKIKEIFTPKYNTKPDFAVHGKTLSPMIFIRKNSSSAKDGIYIYIEFSTTKKELIVSLEIGQDDRYTDKINVYKENIKKVKEKYKNSLNKLESDLRKIEDFELLKEDAYIFRAKLTKFDSLLSFIEAFEPTYAEIIKDIEKYNLEGKIWEQNWEKFQKDIFQDTYVEKVIDNSKGKKNKSEKNNSKKENNTNESIESFNRIYYGIPGCGKSRHIRNVFPLNDDNSTIVTFHPEYTNSDFIGQIMPKRDLKDKSKIFYNFVPGPFTIALENAFKNRNKNYYLVIEEINRGNASAIFGDIFQILDRNDKEKQYKIDNYTIIDYFKEKGIKDNGQEIKKVYLPENLIILATMNTNDQNVYPLDNAFKRRWETCLVPNKFKDDEDYDTEIRAMLVPGTETTWEDFVTTINDKILNSNINRLNCEDKQIGIYFVGKKELVNQDEDNEEIIESKKRRFGEKVLMYLWEDVAKMNPTEWFTKYNSYEKLLEAFNKKGLGVFDGIFKNDKDED